jgi:glutathione S-transferase
MADEIVLYGESNWESPYVFSCFVALREKGVPFEVRTWSLAAGEHRRGDYANRSVTGRVPALVHGEFWLAESSAIDEYLEDVFPPPQYPRLYPAGVQERARARQVQAWLRSDLLPLREERPTTTIFAGRAEKPLSATAQWAAERLLAGCEQLLTGDRRYLFGEEFTIADADLALMLQRLVANRDPVPAAIRDYAERVWSRPSVREFVEHPRRAAT